MPFGSGAASTRTPGFCTWQKSAAVPRLRGLFSVAADFYQVQKPGVRVLAARPLRVREGGWSSELFGDYNLETMIIRI